MVLKMEKKVLVFLFSFKIIVARTSNKGEKYTKNVKGSQVDGGNIIVTLGTGLKLIWKALAFMIS